MQRIWNAFAVIIAFSQIVLNVSSLNATCHYCDFCDGPNDDSFAKCPTNASRCITIYRYHRITRGCASPSCVPVGLSIGDEYAVLECCFGPFCNKWVYHEDIVDVLIPPEIIKSLHLSKSPNFSSIFRHDSKTELPLIEDQTNLTFGVLSFGHSQQFNNISEIMTNQAQYSEQKNTSDLEMHGTNYSLNYFTTNNFNIENTTIYTSDAVYTSTKAMPDSYRLGVNEHEKEDEVDGDGDDGSLVLSETEKQSEHSAIRPNLNESSDQDDGGLILSFSVKRNKQSFSIKYFSKQQIYLSLLIFIVSFVAL
ncbi:hypothetical protein GJ496_010611 [Pomphorhynchus laevis]|nr:hypothetical protein GJ496_010611 [Pomphorhynchus laevis]